MGDGGGVPPVLFSPRGSDGEGETPSAPPIPGNLPIFSDDLSEDELRRRLEELSRYNPFQIYYEGFENYPSGL